MRRIAALLLALLVSIAPACATLSNVVNPLGDVVDRQVVQATDWNGVIDTLYNALNNSLIPAINTLQSTGTNVDVNGQHAFSARLTLQTATPFPNGDINNAGTFFLDPAGGGNEIGIYDIVTSKWILRKLSSEISLAVPSGTRDLVDVFVNWSSGGGTLQLSTSGYQTVTATNNPAAGTSVTITCANTAPFAIGDTISITDGSHQEEASITALVASTSITVDWLQNSFATPVLRSDTPTTALQMQDGVPVLSTDLTKRYVGTALVISNSVTDAVGSRGVGNYYNRVPRVVTAVNTSNTYSQPTGTNMCNQDKALGKERILFVAPAFVNDPISVTRIEHSSSGNGVLFQQFDGGNVGYGAAMSSAQFGMPVSATARSTTVGRHVMDDYIKNTGGSAATMTNIFSTLQCSYTNGWVLN